MKYLKVASFFIIVLFFSACQKNTPYKLFYNEQALSKKDDLSVLIIPPSLIAMNDSIIKQESKKIYDELKIYLEENNLIVLNNYNKFISDYKKEISRTKGLYNPKTGRFNKKKQLELINKTVSKVSEAYDYILVPTIVIKRIKLNKTNYFANWDGVRRKLYKEHNNLPYPTNPLVSSLYTVLLTKNNKMVLKNIVGLDILVRVEKVNTFDNDRETRIARAKSLFNNKNKLRESVSLSLDPFIPLK